MVFIIVIMVVIVVFLVVIVIIIITEVTTMVIVVIYYRYQYESWCIHYDRPLSNDIDALIWLVKVTISSGRD